MKGDGGAVTILLGLHRGREHLAAFLDSLSTQDHRDWRILAGDDSPGDGTAAALVGWADREGRELRIRPGPQSGAAANFMALLASLPADPGPVAFADQDDVWLPGKIGRSLSRLGDPQSAQPVMYCGRSRICAADLRPLRLSPALQRPAGFANALVQNIAAGHTMMFNPAAARLLRAAASRAGTVVVHDWWAYQIVTGAGGSVHFDNDPQVLWRQHRSNAIGAGDRLADRARRLRGLLQGRFREWSTTNISALLRSSDLLTDDNRRLLQGFAGMRDLPARERLQELRRLGLYRQGRAADASLWLAAALGKV